MLLGFGHSLQWENQKFSHFICSLKNTDRFCLNLGDILDLTALSWIFFFFEGGFKKNNFFLDGSVDRIIYRDCIENRSWRSFH